MNFFNPRTRKPARIDKIIPQLLGDGFSEYEGVVNLRLTSGRNDIGILESQLGIRLHRQKETNANGEHYRYSCDSQETARKLINLFNIRAGKKGLEPYTEQQAERIINRFKE